MHPLRFPNSGIRAKVFMRKIGFKLRFHSKGNKEKGQQGMARPPARGRLAAAKAPLQRGGWLRPGPLQGEAARGHDRLQPRPPCKGAAGCGQAPDKGRLPAGVAAHKGQPPAGATAARGHDRLPPGCKGRSPVARSQGAAARGAPARGDCPRRACKGAAANGPLAASPVACIGAATAQWGAKRGLGHPFENWMILPL
ncbi:hypothetical protein BHE74_00042880 [Ensete ventricosum]|nr:hypothetical protein BHE74_00042880 [Ensete ventricosum]